MLIFQLQFAYGRFLDIARLSDVWYCQANPLRMLARLMNKLVLVKGRVQGISLCGAILSSIASLDASMSGFV